MGIVHDIGGVFDNPLPQIRLVLFEQTCYDPFFNLLTLRRAKQLNLLSLEIYVDNHLVVSDRSQTKIVLRMMYYSVSETDILGKRKSECS